MKNLATDSSPLELGFDPVDTNIPLPGPPSTTSPIAGHRSIDREGDVRPIIPTSTGYPAVDSSQGLAKGDVDNT